MLAAIELPNNGASSTQAIGSGRYGVFAPPEDTTLLRVPVAEGRWPAPDELGAVVVSRNLQADEPGLELGADATLVFFDRRTPVRVVGVLEDVSPAALYTNQVTLDAVTGLPGVAGALRIVTEPGAATQVASTLEDALVTSGWFPSFIMTRAVLRASMVDHFLIILILLGAAALAAILVGGLGLATSMSLNVLERTREIGIIRAIGATRMDVVRLLLLEGGAVALASVALAVLLSIPLSAIVTYLTGRHGLYVAVPLILTPAAMVGWLIVALLVAVVACLWPAQRAVRVPVRDVVAYE